MAGSLRQVLQTYSEICLFCSAIQYIVSKKQPVGGAHEVLAESSSETVFDEAHFIVNLHSFLQPLALFRHSFPPSKSFVPIPPGRFPGTFTCKSKYFYSYVTTPPPAPPYHP